MFVPVGEVAPLLPEIPWAIVGLGAVLLWCMAFGTKKTWDYTLGAVLKALADHLNIDAWRIHIHLGGVFQALNDTVEAKLDAALLATETIVGKWWYAQKRLVEITYDSIAWLAHSTVAGFDSLVHGTIPKTVHSVTHTVTTRVGNVSAALRAQVASLERELTRKAHGLEAQIERDFGIAHRGIDYVRGHALPRLEELVHSVEGELDAIRGYTHRVLSRRLSRLEKFLAAGVIGGVAVAAMTRVFPYWQCSNVKRGLRGMCRMDRALLDLLLGAGLEAAVLLNICEAIKLFSATFKEFEPELLGVVAVSGAALKCSDMPTAPPLGGVLPELPPYTGVSLELPV